MIFKTRHAQNDPLDYIVVHSSSRFSRDSLRSELYIRQLGAQCALDFGHLPIEQPYPAARAPGRLVEDLPEVGKE